MYSLDTTASANTSVTSGPFTQGFTFGGINTGTQSTLPGWALPAIAVALVLAVVLWKR